VILAAVKVISGWRKAKQKHF